MKVGRSEQARTATVSHTASLAGSDAASDAFLKRLGIARVDAIPSFLETLKLLHVVGPLAGPRLSSMSCSGGEASVMADSAEGRHVGFPKLGAAHHARVRSTLGPLVTIANPLDYHTFIWNDVPAMTKAFSAMASGGFDLNMLVLDFPRSDRCSDSDWWGAVTAFEAALAANGARGAIVASMGENLAESYAEGLVARGIVPLLGIVEALDAAEAAVFIGEAWTKSTPAPLWGGAVRSDGVAANTASLIPPTPPLQGEGSNAGHPSEAAAKAMLGGFGLPVPEGIEAGSTDEALAAAHRLGFPVAVKALGIAHKSEAGAVRLNLRDEAAVREAAHGLIGLGTGLYVERMIANGVAELIVGVTRDPVFGPVMTVGSGGLLVELLRDSATLLLPASREDIEASLRGLKLFPLLDGYRGRPKADLPATIDAVAGISRFVLAHANRIDELDINPLIACAEGEGAWIADALLIFTENDHD